jgi:hypothetical protein
MEMALVLVLVMEQASLMEYLWVSVWAKELVSRSDLE